MMSLADFLHELDQAHRANRRPAELRSYDPSATEQAAGKIAPYLGDGRAGYERAKKISDAVDAATGWAISGGKDLYDSVKGLGSAVYDSLSNGTPVTKPPVEGRDEFFAKRRTARETIEAAQSRAEQEARSSREYKQAMEEGRRTAAERMVAARKESAAKTWEKGQSSISDEESRINADWEAYQRDLQRQRAEELDKGFAERNPVIAKSMPVGGAIASALLAKYGIGKLNERGAAYAANAAKTFAGNNPMAAQLAATKANEFAGRYPYYQGLTLAGSSTVPVDLRLAGDLIDKYGLPEDSGARQRASDRLSLSNWQEQGADVAKGLISGGIGSFIGSKMAKTPSPTVDLRGVGEILSPDFSAKVAAMGQRQIDAENARRALLAAKKAPMPEPQGANPGAGGGPAPIQPGVGPQGAQAAPQPPPGLPPAIPSPGPYGIPQKAVVRPLIEGEIAAGRSVPDYNRVTSELGTRGIRLPGEEQMNKRLEAAAAFVQDARDRGVPNSTIAEILAGMMKRGTLGFPAVAGMAAGGRALYGQDDLSPLAEALMGGGVAP